MLSNNCSILLIDDDADVLDAYTQLLEQAGYHVSACNNPFDAREQVPKDWPGIVLSDVCMPGCSGIDLMTLFHQDDDLLPILLITGHGDVPMAVEAVKKGAWDFLQKPIDPGKLLTLVDAALRQRQSVIARRQYCQQKLQVELIGRSQWTVRYRQRLQQLAETDIAVWLYGEPGTGRMTGARYLHQLGRHAEGPFIACELTPANAHTLNELIAQAQGGTLVLSHPEHLTHEQQHQLVQLQSHEKRPFRLIGIGSASLVELAASSQIVAELYYCFAMTQIGCQPLSKRPDDIEPLFHHYLQKTCQRLNHPVPEVDAGLLKGMMRRVWPNNVRELANAAELFAVGVLPLAETVNPLMHIGEPTPLDQRVEDVERQIITEALNIHQGRINEVAEYLLIPRKKLYIGRWLQQGGRRERIVLATKVYQPMGPGPNDRRLSAYHIRKACEDSLRRLKTDHIDVYQMHHIDRHTPWEEIWQAMELLVQQGKVLYIGSSNFAGWDIATAQSVATARHFLGLVAEQSLYNLTARTIELEVIPACRHFGLGLIPWSPLAGGLLGGVLKKMASGRRARPAFARLIEQYRPQLEAYEGLCKDLGETPSDVALAWLLQNPVVTAPLIGPRTVEQLQQALHATTVTLSDDTMSCLDEIWPGPGGEAPQAYAW